MGVGLAFCVSAAVGYCALKCREHFGRYRLQEEEKRHERELQPMAGVYHITTTDFDPSVHINDSTPLNNGRVHSLVYGYTGPGHPKGKCHHQQRHKPAGSDSSMEIILNIDVHNTQDSENGINVYTNRTSERRDAVSLPGKPGQTRTGSGVDSQIIVTCLDTQNTGTRSSLSGSMSSTESDEGICLDQECADVSRKGADGEKLISV